VQQAAGRIMQAKQMAPDIPEIDLAVVQSLQSGIYLDILSGALSECVAMMADTPLHYLQPLARRTLGSITQFWSRNYND
jgi:hypothetical protein